MNLVPIKRRQGTGLAGFHDAFDELFNRFFEGSDWLLSGATSWPAIDLAEREDSVVVRAELPGMKAEDIDLQVRNNVLNISGEKADKTEEKGENFYHVESRRGGFRRSIMLPSEVDAEKINAAYKDGILTVTLPKAEKAKPRRIAISEK